MARKTEKERLEEFIQSQYNAIAVRLEDCARRMRLAGQHYPNVRATTTCVANAGDDVAELMNSLGSLGTYWSNIMRDAQVLDELRKEVKSDEQVP